MYIAGDDPLKNYISLMKERLTRYCDIVEGECLGQEWLLSAKYFKREGQTFPLSGKVMDYYDTTEYILFSREVSPSDVVGVIAGLKSLLEEVLVPSPHHRLTTVTRICILDDISEDVARAIRCYRYRKAVRWGMYGWAIAQCAVVDIKTNTVVVSRDLKGREKVFTP